MKKTPVVKDYMTGSLLTIKANTGIYKAIEFLLNNKISGAPVVDNNNKLLGVISEKDCFQLITKGKDNKPPDKVKVADFMTRRIETILPGKDIYYAANIFLKKDFRRLPVVENGRLIGQISRRDVMMAIKDNMKFERPAADIISKSVLITKEEISKLTFPISEVLASKEAIENRRVDLEKATRLGNIEHYKVNIIFEDQEGPKKVNTTIWATTEKRISLKGGINIPINRIHAVKML